MSTPAYTVPDAPADPESAALELIVRFPRQCITGGDHAALTAILQDYCGVLHVEGVFAGMSWADAKQVAATIAFDACTRADAADFMRFRAHNVLSGRDGMQWDDRARAAQALDLAAQVMEQ